jgi:glycosyltransferase involved in cell wall biosynthesis
MRIVQVIDSLAAGGKERQFCELARGLAKRRGLQVHVVVMSEVAHYATLEGTGIPIHILRRRRGGPSAADFFGLLRLLKSLKPDIVQSWNSMCSVYAGPAARLCGAAFVNGAFRNAEARQSRNLRLRTMLTLPFSDVAVANSRAGVAAYRLPAGKAAVIHNGFDHSRLAELRPADEIRRELGVTTPFVVGMVAGFRPDKDYASFLAMAARLTRSRDDITAIAVGDGPTREACQRQFPAADYPRIRFLGRRADAEAIANVFTVGLLTSHSEGISNAVMEFMALGKPVVVSDIPGNRELVEHGRSGYLVTDNDPDALVRHVVALLADTGLAERLGRHARERIVRDFGYQAMVDAYLSLYAAVLEKRRPRAMRSVPDMERATRL